jgi:serine/threonine-protein kinase HipA
MSMPLAGDRYGNDTISNWMWGLLTDNERVLERVAAQHQVSPRNVFALLWAVGEDCSGAVQFADPARIDEMVKGGDVHWLSDREISERLARLRQDNATGRSNNEGQFSLAGAQPKIALLRSTARWGVPSGRIPTTHILKPPMAGLDGHAENEVFCLRLAKKIGMRAAKAEVRRFGDELAIVVERYDRARADDDDDVNGIIRVHQEDFCQALGIHPSLKYERDGGPGIVRIMELLSWSSNAEVDRHRFIQAITFNFLIGGTDAHAKNYSILFGRRQARLAPLYDLASYLPYYERDGRWQDVRMPMRIEKQYRYNDVVPRHWERMAKACNYPVAEAVGEMAKMAASLPEAAQDCAADLRKQGVDHPVLNTLVERIAWWCGEVQKRFA